MVGIEKVNHKDIWVYAQHTDGIISTTTLELLAKASELREKLGHGDKVVAILLGSEISTLATKLIAYGAEKVIVADDPNLAVYKARPYTEVCVSLCEKYSPDIFMLPASDMCRELAPRIMCRLGTGLTADAVDLDIDEDGVFVQTTPAFGGKMMANIAILEKRPQMVTVHPKVFEPLPYSEERIGTVIKETVSVKDDEEYRIFESIPAIAPETSVEGAKIVVSGGRGMRKKEDLAYLRELTELIGGRLGCSRPLCDREWLEHTHQIGQSGATVCADVIVNVAISGSAQYMAGMKNSKCIMSINYTEDAPIFEVSHYGAVADYREFVPAVISEIRRRKA